MRRRHHTFHLSVFSFQFFDDGTMRKWDNEKKSQSLNVSMSQCLIDKKRGAADALPIVYTQFLVRRNSMLAARATD